MNNLAGLAAAAAAAAAAAQTYFKNLSFGLTHFLQRKPRLLSYRYAAYTNQTKLATSKATAGNHGHTLARLVALLFKLNGQEATM